MAPRLATIPAVIRGLWCQQKGEGLGLGGSFPGIPESSLDVPWVRPPPEPSCRGGGADPASEPAGSFLCKGRIVITSRSPRATRRLQASPTPPLALSGPRDSTRRASELGVWGYHAWGSSLPRVLSLAPSWSSSFWGALRASFSSTNVSALWRRERGDRQRPRPRVLVDS